MRITEITKNKSNENYSVFVDDAFAFSLGMEDIIFFRINEGEEISEKTFKYIAEELMLSKAQKKAAKFLGSSKKTESAVYGKLVECGFSEDVCEKVMEILKQYGYVNDLDYAKSFIEDRLALNPKGEYMLKIELRQKGIKDAIINKAIDEADIDEYYYIKALIDKKIGDPSDLNDKELKKLTDFLLRRGYPYGKIKEVIKNYNEF